MATETMVQMAQISFNEVYKANYNKIKTYIGFKLSNQQIADDLTQDVFIRVNKYLHTFDSSKSCLNTWLHTMANQIIIDYIRTNKSSNEVKVSSYVNDNGDEMFQFVGDNRTESNIEREELSNKLSNAFKSLKPSYKKIAILYFIKEKEYKEIAEICNVPMGTVKGMINRARTMLQSELAGSYQVRDKKVLA